MGSSDRVLDYVRGDGTYFPFQKTPLLQRKQLHYKANMHTYQVQKNLPNISKTQSIFLFEFITSSMAFLIIILFCTGMYCYCERGLIIVIRINKINE